MKNMANVNVCPLVSCLCVTYKRHELLKTAIACFQNQSYPNKELIIIGQSDDTETKRIAHESKVPNIHYHVGPKKSIGALRNFSIEKCRGKYFCQWDDDDWHNADRLKFQMAEIQRSQKDANVLAYWIMFDKIKEEAYMSFPLMWAGTILCAKTIYKNGVRYPLKSKNEDTEFLIKLYKRNCVSPLIMPSLYIYVFHGSNTCGPDHFASLFRQAQKLSPKVSRLVSAIVSNEFTVKKSSKLINSSAVLRELDYFRAWISE